MFDSSFFSGNREALAKKLPNSLICISSHVTLQESADLSYPFRQDSSFWYLTGISKPDMVLTIDTVSGVSILYRRAQNAYQKEWDGEHDETEIKNCSGVSVLSSHRGLLAQINEAKKAKKQICYLAPLATRVEPYGFYANPARRMLAQTIKKIEREPRDIRQDIAELRQIKQPAELHAIQQAIDITAMTLSSVKSRLEGLTTEKEVENAITSGFYAHQAEGHAYEPIVASGKNASIIHYNSNDDHLHKNQLLLLDVGAKVGGYAADISRTWSIGSPSNRQKELYKVVLELQNEAMEYVKPGVLLREYQKHMEQRAKDLFAACGISIDTYPHGFSHFLGLDVHDTGRYEEPLQEGSVLTIEPGIYIPDEGIGIRVEDNVLVTKKGIKNLSENIPKML